MDPLEEFRDAYRAVGFGPWPWSAEQLRRFWRAAEVLAACGGYLQLGVTWSAFSEANEDDE